jgi:hypothetical protein
MSNINKAPDMSSSVTRLSAALKIAASAGVISLMLAAAIPPAAVADTQVAAARRMPAEADHISAVAAAAPLISLRLVLPRRTSRRRISQRTRRRISPLTLLH